MAPTTQTTSLHVPAVHRAVAAVPDPELPPVTIGMLGMVHHLDVTEDGAVTVELLPTFSGCPATEMIGQDVAAAVRSVRGVTSVAVRFRNDPPWTADRIDEEGCEQLRRFGISPPTGTIVGAQRPEGRPTLPLAMTDASDPRPCPYCGSVDTVRDAPFGPTPCRDVRFCRACDQPFEAFKS